MTDKKIKDKKLQEIKELKSKCEEYFNGWKHSQADFENYKKQTEKRIKDVIEFGNSEMLLELLPLFSHFNSALSHVKEEDNKHGWFIGLEHIKKLWMDFFEKFGINQIKTVGEKFDHNRHHAVDFEKTHDYEDGIIASEINPGFELNNRVIKPAEVIVYKNLSTGQAGNKIKDSADFESENQAESSLEIKPDLEEKGEQNYETN